MNIVATSTVILPEEPADHAAIELLGALAFGPGRYARTAFRIREQALHDPALSLVAKRDGVVVGSVRMTAIRIGIRPAWLLGPLVVVPQLKGLGIGKALVAHAVAAAGRTEAPTVLLVGDPPYYGPLGFRPVDTARVTLPGPVDPHRLLAHTPDGDTSQLAGAVRAAALSSPPLAPMAADLESRPSKTATA